ncbi:Variant Surface Glycoprotein, putative [Trypanosoma equiperdum]|uniref:Variant Surface Glycoprotein, putative n=1 Tax=Trypanosoma equiperdum TaxID=5694 RepID=A0A1G4I1N3_TRYEQ|nr:Variant Surface Glycoprotein, putative [Trypanosoma equiperdum]
MHTSIVATLTLLTFLHAVSADIEKDAAKVKEPCQKMLFLTEALQILKRSFNNALAQIEDVKREAKLFQLAACTSPTDERRAPYEFLYALAHDRINQAENTIKTAREAMGQHATTIERRIHHLQMLLKHRVGRTNYPTDAVPGAEEANVLSSGTAKNCKITVDNDQTKELKCLTTVQDKEAITRAAKAIRELKEIHATPDTGFGLTGLEITIEAVETVADVDKLSPDKNGCAETGGNAAAKWHQPRTATKISQTAAAITTKQAKIEPDGGANDGKCKKPVRTENAILVTTDMLSYAICKLRSTTVTGPQKLSQEKIENIANDNTAQRIAELLSTGKIDATTPTEKRAEMVIALLGDKSKTVEEQLITPLKSKTPNYGIEGNQNAKNLKDLSTSGDYAAALAFCSGKAVREVAATRKPQATEEKKLADCKGTEEDDCGKEKCEFKDGKCQVKESVKAENDAKNTNTTGSNSLLINKTPLLLAFLI